MKIVKLCLLLIIAIIPFQIMSSVNSIDKVFDLSIQTMKSEDIMFKRFIVQNKPIELPQELPIVIESIRPYVVVSRNGEEEYVDQFIGCVTKYTEGFKSCGKHKDNPAYGITASGRRVKVNHTIAMDKRFPFGTLVMIEGFDDIIFEVEDRGGAITGNDVDVYIPEEPNGEKLADEWGMRDKKITIIKLGERKK